MREPCVRTAQLSRDLRMLHGEALDVHLIDHRVRPRCSGCTIVGPVEVISDDDAAGNEGRGVGVVTNGVVALDFVAEYCRVQIDDTINRSTVRIEQPMDSSVPARIQGPCTRKP